MFYRFVVISKSINFAAHLSKWPSKNKSPTRTRSPTTLLWSVITVCKTLHTVYIIAHTIPTKPKQLIAKTSPFSKSATKENCQYCFDQGSDVGI